MREVAPGDLVLSFERTHIRAVSIVQSYCYESPKPAEFGAAGPNWEKVGWRVDVHYHDLRNSIRPADHMAVLGALLPQQYSPLQPNGRGLQSVYLTAVPEPLMMALSGLIGNELTGLLRMTAVAEPLEVYERPQIDWEEHLQAEIASNSSLDETQKQQLILARRGQGDFRRNVQAIEYRCRVTKVDRPEHLRASHCKPWRDCESSDERLNGENGLLLTPSIDHLFDRGFISFDDNGELLVSPVAHATSLNRMGISTSERLNVGRFSQGQRCFLDFHRNFVFLEAAVATKRR